MTALLIGNSVMFGIFASIWNRSDALNSVIKTVLWIGTFANLFYLFQAAGWIVKVGG